MTLDAPSHWRCVDFISDLHLQSSELLTFSTWTDYLRGTVADAVFILGDLFEVWVGDDMLSLDSGFEKQCADTLWAASQRLDLYILRGNRDFLMGTRLMNACGGTLLEDPTVLSFANDRWLLTHGDAWCLEDTDYMQFRTLVRTQQWQQAFLCKPLMERVQIARSMRAQSEARKDTKTSFIDVDQETAINHLAVARASHIIHGHTHRPGHQVLGKNCERLVLSDWDMTARQPRAEVLRLRHTCTSAANSYSIERIPPNMAMSPKGTTPNLVD